MTTRTALLACGRWISEKDPGYPFLGWRTAVGLLGFLAIEAAVFARYTNIVVLACAVLAVLILRCRRPGELPPRAAGWWVGSAVLFCGVKPVRAGHVWPG